MVGVIKSTEPSPPPSTHAEHTHYPWLHPPEVCVLNYKLHILFSDLRDSYTGILCIRHLCSDLCKIVRKILDTAPYIIWTQATWLAAAQQREIDSSTAAWDWQQQRLAINQLLFHFQFIAWRRLADYVGWNNLFIHPPHACSTSCRPKWCIQQQLLVIQVLMRSFQIHNRCSVDQTWSGEVPSNPAVQSRSSKNYAKLVTATQIGLVVEFCAPFHAFTQETSACN